MSNPVHPLPISVKKEKAEGPNLVLLYSLVVLALVAAIGIAIMIVLPFYLRR